MSQSTTSPRLLSELKALTFDDFPSDTETVGSGVHQGKRFRTLQCEALDGAGSERRYTLRWTRHAPPVEALEAKLATANKKLFTLQEKDNVRDFTKYCDQLTKANDHVDKLQDELRDAKRAALPAPADSLKVTDHGATAAQVQRDRADKQAENLQRPSAAFLKHIMAGSDVSPSQLPPAEAGGL